MIRLFITLPVIVALIIFAACNQAPVELSWLQWKWTSSPGVLALLVAALFYATGSASVWIVVLRQMRRARRAGLASAPIDSPMVQAYAAGQPGVAHPAPAAGGTAVTEAPTTPERPPGS